VYVNTATGNLVVQNIDEMLTARGLDLALARTYNSQGLVDGDNDDNWRMGAYRSVHGLTGTVNTAGSKVFKTFGDGADVEYTYDDVLGKYRSTDGDGAHDTLEFDDTSSTWTWTDESSRATETYDSDGRLTEARDADDNLVTYSYDGDLLDEIVDASGQQTIFEYDGDLLTAVHVISDSATQTLTRYDYDTAGRLTSVTVDLSPEDNSIADDDVYVTDYTYDGTSNRVASITQADGSSLAITYQFIDGEYRVHTLTDGANRVTTYTYTNVTVGSGGGGAPGVGSWGDVTLLDAAAGSGAALAPLVAFDENG
jgi:YD repeat-containing protein